MSMPQYFQIIVVSEFSEISSIAAAVLNNSKYPIHPKVVGSSINEKNNSLLITKSNKYRLLINESISVNILNPKEVELWLVLDYLSKEAVKRHIRKYGPAPKGYYRSIFPNPILLCDIDIPKPQYIKTLKTYIESIEILLQPYKEKLITAYYESS